MLIPNASVQTSFQNPVKSVADATLEQKHRKAAVATTVTLKRMNPKG